ncbi:MAG TPA: hypothetical protein VM537_16105 [Anaerolineae bacterium]|nr:hypothetical protein [Anaerolineae bacterium]HUX02443.1 hypothetical protein [Phycisphaerae bacterium]
MKVGEAFTGSYLKAANILGKRVGVTIDRVVAETVGEDTKPVVYFKGKELGLVLNVTNANMIAEIAGDDEMDNWAGTKLVLYSCKVDYQGKRVDAIRVDHPGVPAKPVPPPVPTSEFEDDEAPF